MKKPETLEDFGSVSGGWRAPQDALALRMLAAILRPICHCHTHQLAQRIFDGYAPD